MTYEFPSTMSNAVQKEYLRQCIKGEVLYELNCAKCHTKKNLFTKKIPDFTPDQIYGYELRRSNKQHETAISATNVTTEEIGYILNFLMYKKKSGLVHISTEHH
jgi:hypothetical protein